MHTKTEPDKPIAPAPPPPPRNANSPPAADKSRPAESKLPTKSQTPHGWKRGRTNRPAADETQKKRTPGKNNSSDANQFHAVSRVSKPGKRKRTAVPAQSKKFARPTAPAAISAASSALYRSPKRDSDNPISAPSPRKSAAFLWETMNSPENQIRQNRSSPANEGPSLERLHLRWKICRSSYPAPANDTQSAQRRSHSPSKLLALSLRRRRNSAAALAHRAKSPFRHTPLALRAAAT